jgi:hypothetical protein
MSFLETIQTFIAQRQAFEARLPPKRTPDPKKRPQGADLVADSQQRQEALKSTEMVALQTTFNGLAGPDRRKLCAIARAGTYGDSLQTQFNCIGEDDAFALTATSTATQAGLAKVAEEKLDIEADWTPNAPALPATPSQLVAQEKFQPPTSGAQNGTPALS